MIRFFLFETRTGRVVLSSEHPPSNTGWLESGNLSTHEGHMIAGVKWGENGLSAFYEPEGLPGTPGLPYMWDGEKLTRIEIDYED